MELAMEISANEFIREPLPGHPIVWTDYRDLGIRPSQSTRERYDLLCQARARGQVVLVPAALDDHLAEGVGVAGRRSWPVSDPEVRRAKSYRDSAEHDKNRERPVIRPALMCQSADRTLLSDGVSSLYEAG